MVRHMTSNSDSELWKNLPWKKFRKNLFRLQCRVWKAIRVGDRKRANSLQKLILKSRSARLLAIRQVTQLNQGKKTALLHKDKMRHLLQCSLLALLVVFYLRTL